MRCAGLSSYNSTITLKRGTRVELGVESVAVGWRKRNHSMFRVFTHTAITVPSSRRFC